jgi:hypothetical protein
LRQRGGPGKRAAGGRREAAAGLSPGERSLLGFFGAAWTIALLHLAGLLPLAGSLPISLYFYYAFAACAGWLAGNVFVLRRRRGGASRQSRRLLTILYLFGPPSLVYLLRSLAPPAHQQAAPLAPLWAFGVYGVFFLVPLVFPPPARKAR